MEPRSEPHVNAPMPGAEHGIGPTSSSTPLLGEPVHEHRPCDVQPGEGEAAPERVLVLSFTTAFAVAATSATSIYAYASLMCRDPSHCRAGERGRYAGTVAAASVTANVFGVAAVFVLRRWTETHPKRGLCLWFISRCLGVAMLAIGVFLDSIYIAVAGRIFEGLANDNLLSYALAAIYVRANDPDRFSRLMGTSLALYMSGAALSPTLVTLLPGFFPSFIIAMVVLLLSLVYLGAVRIGDHVEMDSPTASTGRGGTLAASSPFAPMSFLFKDRAVILPALTIFFFNSVQSYLFPLILVHASLRFGFDNKENGYVVSIAALTSAIYLAFVLYLLPKLQQKMSKLKVSQSGEPGPEAHHNSQHDWAYAVLSMSVQLVVLPGFMAIRAAWAVYMMVVLVALGLSSPSFIKSYAVEKACDKSQALATLAVMETLGAMVSPIVLGSAQTLVGPGAFAVASGLVGAAMLSFVGSLFI